MQDTFMSRSLAVALERNQSKLNFNDWFLTIVIAQCKWVLHRNLPHPLIAVTWRSIVNHLG